MRISDWSSDVCSSDLHLPPAAVLASIMLFVTLLTNFASNATAATVGTPIAFNIATQLDMPAEPLILAVLFGCNLCYATPIAYQTNMLIMAEGRSEEHTSELQSLMRTSYACLSLKKTKNINQHIT